MTVDSLRGRDLLTLQDLTSKELLELVKAAQEIKEKKIELRKTLSGKVVVLIFEKPSTRTRISIETAIAQLNGKSIYARSDELQLSRGESIQDTARVLSRYVDAIVARVRRHRDLIELARYSSVPVINALSDLDHPLQTLADLLTIYEKFGRFKGLKIAWIGDGNNVCNSTLIAASKLGMNMSIATPRDYRPNRLYLELAANNAEKSGAEIEVIEDPEKAVKDADVVMTDTFVSMGMESEREKRLKAFLPKYRVTSEMISKAKANAIFMHPLPARRGEEVSSDVIDGERSVVWDQAENRLHTAKAVLLSILG